MNGRQLPINVNRWQNKVRAIFGMHGENPIPTIEELLPVVSVEQDRPEWELPGGELLWFTVGSTAAVVGETGFLVLWNPPNSGLLQIIEFYDNTDAAAGQYFYTRTDPADNAGFVASNLLMPRDTRAFERGVAGFASPIGMRLHSGTLTAAEVAAYVTALVSPSGFDDGRAQGPFVISPGFGFGFTPNAANLAATVLFGGRQHIQERGLSS